MENKQSKIKTRIYSFDLWNTLIKPNPEFGIARAKFIQKEWFNNTPEEEIVKEFRKASILFNKINEITGMHTDAKIMIGYVLHKLDGELKDISSETIEEISCKQNELFLKHPPLIYDENTLSTIKKIKRNAYIGIISNTGFIGGHTLRDVLIKLKFPEFRFMIFSDEVKISKPNPEIFKKALGVISWAYDIYQCYRHNYPDPFICHIGDNEIADIQGANAVPGWEGFQINSNERTILDVLNLQKEII